MVRIPVYLNNMTDAKHLVQIAEACKNDVDLICGRYVVDAKSMLGVFLSLIHISEPTRP